MSQESNNNFKQVIEKATNPSLQSEDWEANVQLCDMLCQRPDEISQVVLQILLHKLASNNPKIQLLTLTLLDACVKNTTDLFVRNVTKPNNIRQIELLGSSSNAEVRDRCINVLEEWKKDYGNKFPQFTTSYAIVTGKKSSPPSTASSAQQSTQSLPLQANQHLTVREKIENDMKVVKENAQKLIQIVNSSSNPNDLKNEANLQVVVNCREMHSRLISLIEKVPQEDLLLKLLSLNDELYGSIDCYDKYRHTGVKNLPSEISSNNSAQEQELQKKQKQSMKPTTDKDAGNSVDDIFGPFVPPPTKEVTSNVGSAKLDTSSSSSVFNLDDILAAPSQTNAPPANPFVSPIQSSYNPYMNHVDSIEKEFERVSQQNKDKQNINADDIFSSLGVTSNGNQSTNNAQDMLSPGTSAGFAAIASRRRSASPSKLNSSSNFENFLNSKMQPSAPPAPSAPSAPSAPTQKKDGEDGNDIFTLE